MQIDNEHNLGDEENEDVALAAETDEGDAYEAPNDSGDGSDEADDARAELEAKAREQGWKPIDDWKGDKSGWVDAGDYLERTKPQRLRETIDRQSQELAELKRQREADRREFEERSTRWEKFTETSLKRQREQTLAQIEAARRRAAEEGDMDAYDDLGERQAQIAEDLDKQAQEFAPREKPKQQEQQAPDPSIQSWIDKNPAVRFNGPKWQAAVAFFSEAEGENPNGTIADHLAHVEERLNQTWPGTVRKSKPNGAANGNGQARPQTRSPQLESNGRIATRPARGKGWTDIPAEERKVMERHIREGLYKDQADAAGEYWKQS